ncbi:hypothetical protein [Aurantimonas endophytica]|uniref:Uncharacterized protein n=1 Tax=Aurantimonas endophytica TaxID=1522175 RepID=A0A7W6MMN0_9HYPH|nr:hypothetical protein [Aurantimonas endophytica]MBB4000978.1 hypothetical protein [Aurantimonas endophytica]MCO6403363.1 hypothetical protein [Aurantimonas endophytica]
MADILYNREETLLGYNVVLAKDDGRPYLSPGKPFVQGYLDRLRANGDRLGIVPEDVPMNEVFGGMWLPGDLEPLVPRPAITATVSKAAILADGADKAVISGLPKPCVVRVDGQSVERKGGTLTLTADVPGTYRIEVDQWPYLPWSVEIVAT